MSGGMNMWTERTMVEKILIVTTICFTIMMIGFSIGVASLRNQTSDLQSQLDTCLNPPTTEPPTTLTTKKNPFKTTTTTEATTSKPALHLPFKEHPMNPKFNQLKNIFPSYPVQ